MVANSAMSALRSGENRRIELGRHFHFVGEGAVVGIVNIKLGDTVLLIEQALAQQFRR